MNKAFFVYMLTNERNGVLYIGVTSSLPQRIWQHKEKLVKGFTERHGLNQLVWFEPLESAVAAIAREKQLKRWRREWKIELIEAQNPYWRDLYPEIV